MVVTVEGLEKFEEASVHVELQLERITSDGSLSLFKLLACIYSSKCACNAWRGQYSSDEWHLFPQLKRLSWITGGFIPFGLLINPYLCFYLLTLQTRPSLFCFFGAEVAWIVVGATAFLAIVASVGWLLYRRLLSGPHELVGVSAGPEEVIKM